jgi:hypothetical protein
LELWTSLAILGLSAVVALVVFEIRRRQMSRWIVPYVRERRRFTAPCDGEIHVLLCIADHFEPRGGGADAERGLERVRKWATEYPRQFARFRDSDGRPPRYTFFFPAEEYDTRYLDLLAQLCKAGFGEVEVHLHHHADTSAGFRQKIESFTTTLVERHGLLGRDQASGALRYAFIHGNWALCNSRPDGRLCGVNDELAILKSTGCFADLTFPSAPDITQPPILNRIYYARDIPGRSASHEVGTPIGEVSPGPEDLMLIQGPLILDWTRPKWGVLPRLENGCLQGSQLPSMDRLATWLRAHVQVPSRPEWYFVKLHAHGAPEDAHEALLGEPMVRFHAELDERMKRDPKFHVHYVTAREMYNLARAAEAGFSGKIIDGLNFEVASNITLS